MRPEVHKPTLRALRARRQGWQIAMSVLYPRLRVKRKPPPQARFAPWGSRRVLPYEWYVVSSNNGLYTALAAVAVIAMILSTTLLLSRLL